MKDSLGQFFRHSSWIVDDQLLHPGEYATFDSISTLQQSTMTAITLDARSGVSKLDLQASYYVKTFKEPGSRLKFCLNASRYQRELLNLQYFRTIGLNTPRLIAYGHQAQLGIMQQAVLVTAAVDDAVDLEQLVKSGDLYRDGIPAARKILARLATAARTGLPLQSDNDNVSALRRP